MGPSPSRPRPPAGPAPDHRLRAVVVALLLVAVGLAGFATPAGAHASLVSTDPADGATVDAPPETVTLTFTEPVSLGAGGVEVLDDSGEPVHEGEAVARDRQVTVGMRPDLDEGTYVISYRVTSADGHPVSGATTFGLGVEPDAGAADAAVDDDGQWRWIAAAGRALSYLGLLLATGGAVFLAVVADPDLPRRPFRRIVPAAAVAAVVSVPLLVVSQAGRLSGAGWDVVTDGDVLAKALEQGLGWQAVLTVVAAGLAVVAARATGPRALVLAEASVVTGAVAVIMWGHARAADPAALAVVGDAFHVAAAAVWFGGVVLLAWMLVANVGTPDVAARTVARFSSLAGFVVIVLAVGGGALAYAEVGELEALWDTSYGQLLLSKLAIVALVLVLAAWNRGRLLPAIQASLARSTALDAEEGSPRSSGGDPVESVVGAASTSTAVASGGAEASGPDGGSVLVADRPADDLGAGEAFERARRAWRHLRRTMVWELVGLVAVVGVTTVLVETTPPGDEAADAAAPPGGLFDGQAPVGDATLSVQVTPGVAGANQIHLSYIGPDGTLADVAEEVTLELSLPDADLGPIERQPDFITEGHLIYSGNDLSIPGVWEVTVVSRLSRFEEERSTFEVPIGTS